MGYSTDFTGQFDLDKPLSAAHMAYLQAFSETRRMQRNASLTAVLGDPVRIAVGLGIGEDGGYFVGATGFSGQDHTNDIVEYNNPPSGQPGLWCQWVPSDDGSAILWNGAEKFYNYIEWLDYLIEHFIKPWGYKLSGEVSWFGEDSADLGKIKVKNNKVTVLRGEIKYRKQK